MSEEIKDTRTAGPSKSGVPEAARAGKPSDPRSPAYDKKLDGPLSPRT